MLLRSTHDNVKSALRWEVILACWDEYAATRLSAGIGEDQSHGYETTLLNSMQSAREEANDAIRAYRLHGNVDRLVADVYRVYGTLLKFAAYYLGNLDGLGVPLESRPTLALLMRNHWFAPFFAALHSGCHRIAEAYGSWEDRTCFEALGTLCEEVVAAGGVHWRLLPTGELWVNVPET